MSTPTKSSVADDVEIVRRILAHIDAGTTDEGDAWREPVANYLDPLRFTDELEILRYVSHVYLPSAAIPQRGRSRRTGHLRRAAVRGARPRRPGAGCSATRAAIAAWRWSRARLRATRWCAAITAGPTASTARCRMSPRRRVPRSRHAQPRPGRGRQPRGGRPYRHRPVGPPASTWPRRRRRDGVPSDGSPWRDKLLPAERLVYVDSTARPMNWKVPRRAVPRGLPHPLDAQGHLLSDSVRRSQRRRNVWSEQSNHVPLPEH